MILEIELKNYRRKIQHVEAVMKGRDVLIKGDDGGGELARQQMKDRHVQKLQDAIDKKKFEAIDEITKKVEDGSIEVDDFQKELESINVKFTKMRNDVVKQLEGGIV